MIYIDHDLLIYFTWNWKYLIVIFFKLLVAYNTLQLNHYPMLQFVI